MNNYKLNNFINIPNLVTILALALSLAAIVILMKGEFYLSFSFIILALTADTLDGYLARKLNKVSDFGRQLDGHVDVFIYLIYPALVFYLYFSLNDYLSLVVIFIFLASGIIRLVRFNIIGYVSGNLSDRSYPGLPVFMNHVLLVILFLISYTNYFYFLANALIFITSILMLLTFPFPKPKNIKLFIVLFFVLAILSFLLS